VANATPEVLEGEDINYEWILALDPDLIIAVYFELDADSYARLSQIAPVVANPEGFPLWGAPWQVELTLIDKATSGTTAKAEAIVAGLEEKFVAARAAYPELTGRTAVNAYLDVDSNVVVWNSADVASRFLTSLGMVFPDALEAASDDIGRAVLSLEQLKLIDLDAVVWPAEQGDRAKMETLAVYRNLRLYAENRSVWLDDPAGVLSSALSFQTPLSIAYLLERLPAMLSAAVDGDPATEVQGR
jgi:iron complex transport system substrate-binding protein